MGIGRRTDVVSDNMQWVDIEKIGYKFLIITDFLDFGVISSHVISDIWDLSPFPQLVGEIHCPRSVLSDVPHRAFRSAVAPPPLAVLRGSSKQNGKKS